MQTSKQLRYFTWQQKRKSGSDKSLNGGDPDSDKSFVRIDNANLPLFVRGVWACEQINNRKIRKKKRKKKRKRIRAGMESGGSRRVSLPFARLRPQTHKIPNPATGHPPFPGKTCDSPNAWVDFWVADIAMFMFIC